MNTYSTYIMCITVYLRYVLLQQVINQFCVGIFYVATASNQHNQQFIEPKWILDGSTYTVRCKSSRGKHLRLQAFKFIYVVLKDKNLRSEFRIISLSNTLTQILQKYLLAFIATCRNFQIMPKWLLWTNVIVPHKCHNLKGLLNW